jgi:hypothetical protein
MNGMLVEYGEPNFTTNAAIEDIISPSTHDEYLRWNPICDDARIRVSNQGSDEITSLDFTWKIGETTGNFRWTGSLEFLENTEIVIPLQFEAFNIFQNINSKVFEIEITSVNDSEDQYTKNNSAQSAIQETDNFFEDFRMSLRTNNYAAFNINYAPMTYRLINLTKNEVVFQDTDGNLPMSQIVEETADLETGCYEMTLENLTGYGLGYWILDQYNFGSGFFRLGNQQSLNQSFQIDFGNRIYYQFKVAEKIEGVLNKEIINFGEVESGNKKTEIITIKPNTSLPLEIYEVTTGFGIVKGFNVLSTNPEIVDDIAIIEPGEEMEIVVEYEAFNDNMQTSELTITTNNARFSTYKVELIANGVSSVDLHKDNIRLTAKPNPVSGPMYIEFGLETNKPVNTKIELYNLLGNKVADVYEGLANIQPQNLIFNTDYLNSGIYYLKLTAGNENKTIPVIVEN